MGERQGTVPGRLDLVVLLPVLWRRRRPRRLPAGRVGNRQATRQRSRKEVPILLAQKGSCLARINSFQELRTIHPALRHIQTD